MTISLEHHELKANLETAAQALGVRIDVEDAIQTSENGRVQKTRVYRVPLPKPSKVRACFVREGWLERAKKVFVSEVESGLSWFDDLIYVVTDTRDATAELLKARRVQQALVLIVDSTCRVEVDAEEIRVIDEEVHDDGHDKKAELLALTAHVLQG